MTKGFWILFGLFLITAGSAGATEIYELPRSARTLGMGGVYLPFVEDVDAVLWNPAVLAETGQLSWEIIDVNIGVNGKEVYDLYKQMQDSGCSGPTCYSSFYGKPLWVSLFGATKFVAPRLGVTFYQATSLEGTLHNPVFPRLNLTYLSDTGYAAGYGFPLGPNFTGGVSVKRVARRGGNQDVSMSTITSGGQSVLDEFNQRGVGYGFDLGTQYKLDAGPFATIFGIHWQDVGSTAFVAESGLQAPPRIKDNLSAGIGAEMDLPGLDLRAGAEYRQITLQGEPLGKKLHMGVELGLPLIDVRAGLNQGYPTLGATVDFFFLKLDAASYSEEVGAYPGQTPSQRYKVELSCAFSIDADFSFTDKQGKRRKLKQRR